MEKGQQITLKNGQVAIYKGNSYDAKKPHLIELINSNTRLYVASKDIVGQEEPKAPRKAASGSLLSLRRKRSIITLEDKKIDLQSELDALFADQDLEVGQLEGGTDEFEATGQHNVYGRKMNAIQSKIDRIDAKITELKHEGMVLAEEINEAVNLLEKVTNKKVSLK